jgi:hypothetical protein
MCVYLSYPRLYEYTIHGCVNFHIVIPLSYEGTHCLCYPNNSLPPCLCNMRANRQDADSRVEQWHLICAHRIACLWQYGGTEEGLLNELEMLIGKLVFRLQGTMTCDG